MPCTMFTLWGRTDRALAQRRPTRSGQAAQQQERFVDA